MQDERLTDWITSTFGEKAKEWKGANHSRLETSDEPLSWDRGGVVRLDVAIAAVKMCAARIVVESMPESFDDIISDAIGTTARVAGGWFAVKTVKQLARAAATVAKAFVQIATIVSEAQVQTALEKKLRKQVLDVRRELLLRRLKPNKKRRYREISTRHGTT